MTDQPIPVAAEWPELKEAVIRYSVAVACFENGLGAAEDVKSASDDLCALGLRLSQRLSQHEAATLHQCGACQLAALTDDWIVFEARLYRVRGKTKR